MRLALAFVGLCHLALALFLDDYGHTERTLQPADAVVVLGAGVQEDGLAGRSLQARAEHGVALYRRGIAPKILFTGGLGSHPPTEARAAANVALAMNVTRTAILQEDLSRSTWENALFSRPILLKAHAKRVIVVSDARHLWRAEQNFAAQGFEVQSSPAYGYENTWQFGWRWVTPLFEAISVERDFLALRYFGDPLPIDAH